MRSPRGSNPTTACNTSWPATRPCSASWPDGSGSRQNPSDYDLTGLIICPRCGRKYIGTNATGRNRTYSYYTCFSRQRYGTKNGCDAHRFNAHALDTAIRDALIDFYTTGDDLITQAVAQFQQAHQDSHADLRRELAGIDKQRGKTQAAIDRYLTAFEAGTMDPEIRQPRLAELAERANQLRARHTELAADLDHPPAAPSPPSYAKSASTSATSSPTARPSSAKASTKPSSTTSRSPATAPSSPSTGYP